ncbi:unnamed protein product [Aphanomyces euteiches]
MSIVQSKSILGMHMTNDKEGEIEAWTSKLAVNAKNALALRSRGTLYLELGRADDAELDARSWLALEPKVGAAHGLLGVVLMAQRRFDEAVKTYKHGIQADPKDETLHDRLRRARIAVIDELAADEDIAILHPATREPPQPATSVPSAPETTTPLPPLPRQESSNSSINPSRTMTTPSTELQNFSGQPVSTLLHLVLRLVWLILLDLHRSSPHLSNAGLLVAVGIVGVCVQNWLGLLLLAVAAIGLVYMPSRLEQWMETSSDKLYTISLIPCMLACVPMVLKVVGLYNLFWFIHQDNYLALGLLVYFVVVLHTKQSPKLVKAGMYLLIVLYWVVYRRHHRDMFRFIPPASFELASFILAGISPMQVQQATKRSLATLLTELSPHVNLWGVLALGHWAVDFWSQPSSFTIEDILASFRKVQGSAINLFQTEIQAYRASHDGRSSATSSSDDYAVMVAYVAKTIRALPPSKRVAAIVMVLQRCVHTVVFLLLFLRGHICLALMPLMAQEIGAFQGIVHAFTEFDTSECDTLDIICNQSPPLLTVWTNVKAGVYCMECSVTATKVAVAATSATLLATQLSHLATTVAAVRREGVVHHMDNLIDVAATLFESRHLIQPIHEAWIEVTRRWWARPS